MMIVVILLFVSICCAANLIAIIPEVIFNTMSVKAVVVRCLFYVAMSFCSVGAVYYIIFT